MTAPRNSARDVAHAEIATREVRPVAGAMTGPGARPGTIDRRDGCDERDHTIFKISPKKFQKNRNYPGSQRPQANARPSDPFVVPSDCRRTE